MAKKANENASANYSVVISEASKEFSPKERIMMKDTSDAVRLDMAVKEGAFTINPVAWAVLDIHNEKADDVDYKNFIVIDADGTKYVTGSNAFWSSFRNIFDEMFGSDEQWALKIYEVPSKNYKGKSFITCSLV